MMRNEQRQREREVDVKPARRGRSEKKNQGREPVDQRKYEGDAKAMEGVEALDRLHTGDKGGVDSMISPNQSLAPA